MEFFEAMGKAGGLRHGRQFLSTVALALLGGSCLLSPALAAPPEPFVMGTEAEETTLVGKWYRRIYGEAFARMGVPLTMVVLPTARATIFADQGEIHGQPTRLFAYAEAHPNQLRVDEVVLEARLLLHAFGPETSTNHPKRVEELAASKSLVEYRRGVAICEKILKPRVPAERLSDVTSTEQGLKKLRAGRTDLYCDFDASVKAELLTPTFKGETGFRKALDLGAVLPLYPYIHKSRAELAPRLAATLKKMKAEGLIERYQREVERELGVAP